MTQSNTRRDKLLWTIKKKKKKKKKENPLIARSFSKFQISTQGLKKPQQLHTKKKISTSLQSFHKSQTVGLYSSEVPERSPSCHRKLDRFCD